MPFLIETYRNRNNALSLVNVDTCTLFDNKDDANKCIALLLEEQKQDNKSLMDDYTDRLQAQVMDIDTDDRILREPTLYAYIYKAAKYSNRQIKNMA